jgi:hypothetical protein
MRTKYNHLKVFIATLVLLLVVSCFTSQLHSQSMANYTFTTGTGESLVDMSSGTTDLIANTGSRISDQRSSVTTFPEGFRFWFMGVEYSQISVNSNGIARLGGTQIATTTYNYGASGQALLCPLGRTTSGLAVGEGGKVHYKLIGTFPERKLVIEWKEVEINKNTSGATADCGDFQLILTEVENSIEFRYSDGIKVRSGGATTEYRVGISSSNTATTIHTVSNLNSGTLSSANSATIASNTATANSTITNLQDGRYIKFTPTASVTPRTNISFSAVGTTSMTVHWSGTTDSKTAIYYSIDGVNWTRGNVTLLSSTTSSSISGLKCGADYQWRVYTTNAEGRFSTPLEGNQATNICQPSSNGHWHTASIWPGNQVPDSYQNVTIPSPRNITISSYTEDAFCNNLNLNSGATLTIASSKKLVVAEDFNIEGTVNVTSTQGCNGGGGTTCVKCSDCGTPNTNDNIPIYRGSERKVRVQFLYLKAELSDLDEKVVSGFTFNYGYMSAPPNSFDLENLTIRVGHTSTSAFASSFINPSDFTTTYGPSTYSVSNSSSTFSVSFTQGFIYDENADNLLIEMTYETDGNALPYVNTIRYSGCGSIPNNTVIITANNCAGSPQDIIYDNGCTGKFVQQGSARPGLLVSNCNSEDWGEFNGDIDISGDWLVSSTGEFNPGQGTVSFIGNQDQTITPRTYNIPYGDSENSFYDLVINQEDNDKSLTINTTNANDSIVVTNSLTLNQGVIKPATNNGVSVRNSSANAVVYDVLKSNSGWIDVSNGSLRRRVANNTDTYGFPVGTDVDYRLAELINDELSGIYYIDASFTTSPDHSGGAELDEDKAVDFGTPYDTIIAGAWQFVPNLQPSSGSYNLKLYFDGGGENPFNLSNNTFGILRRPDNSDNAADWDAIGTINANGGEGRLVSHGYALRMGYNSFSEYTIAEADGPLPIELTRFEVNCQGSEKLLSWTTATEINNHYFTLERSFDALHWEVAGTVQGAGTSLTIINYTFTDTRQDYRTVYYRLKQTDYDGTFEYSRIISANCASNTLSIYPNPNSGLFEVSGLTRGTTLYIYSSLGQLLHSQVAYSTTEVIQTRNLSPGTYILKAVDYSHVTTAKFQVK